MTLLSIGIIVFITIHLLPAFPSLRALVIEKMSEIVYMGVFSLISLIALLLIIWGKATAEFIHLWSPPLWTHHFAMTVMLIAFICLIAAYVPCNLKRRLRHPMLIGVALWSIAHLSTNGDLASIILFGGFGGFALLTLAIVGFHQTDHTKYSLLNDGAVIVLGSIVYTILLFSHTYLFNVPIVYF